MSNLWKAVGIVAAAEQPIANTAVGRGHGVERGAPPRYALSMAIIVRYAKNDKLYILLGTGHAMFKSARPGAFLGDMFPTEEGGSESKVAVCDEEGRIVWGLSDDLTVVSVDDESPGNLLGRARDKRPG